MRLFINKDLLNFTGIYKQNELDLLLDKFKNNEIPDKNFIVENGEKTTSIIFQSEEKILKKGLKFIKGEKAYNLFNLLLKENAENNFIQKYKEKGFVLNKSEKKQGVAYEQFFGIKIFFILNYENSIGEYFIGELGE